jgi:hypothetical protein
LPAEKFLLSISENLQNPIDLDSSGNIVIYVKDLDSTFEVQVQSITAKESFRDTMYGGDSE